MRLAVPVVIALLGAVAGVELAAQSGPLSATFPRLIDDPAIAYKFTLSADPIAGLLRRVDAGEAVLKGSDDPPYLRSLLEALQIPVESQIVVFAEDSVQRDKIRMNNPRSLFFNDSVAVGWVRGGFIEIAAQDPRQGAAFYSLRQDFTGAPQWSRRGDCLTCHCSYSTAGVPGMLARSAGQFVVDHTTPIEHRWGGWFVTGTSGSIAHSGNATIERVFAGPPSAETLNWPSFAGKFDTSGYLTTHSDIVALMVFEHQMHLMNLLTRIGWDARVAAGHAAQSAAASRADDGPFIPISEGAVEVVDYMLFVDEAPIADAIAGSTPFRERFEALGPFDRQHRSLRQFDLHRRLLKYPCSYLIYSPQFDALPPDAKDALYRRLWQVLSGGEQDAKYQKLARADRQAIVEILHDTKPDLPAYFEKPTQ